MDMWPLSCIPWIILYFDGHVYPNRTTSQRIYCVRSFRYRWRKQEVTEGVDTPAASYTIQYYTCTTELRCCR